MLKTGELKKSEQHIDLFEKKKRVRGWRGSFGVSFAKVNKPADSWEGKTRRGVIDHFKRV